jgi:uncharacterized UBP type Zn finger protein
MWKRRCFPFSYLPLANLMPFCSKAGMCFTISMSASAVISSVLKWRVTIRFQEFIQFNSQNTHPDKFSQWFCPKCKQNRDSEHGLAVYSPPPFLCVNLKRFSNDVEKINHHVKFPQFLNLEPYLDPRQEDGIKKSCRYKLSGVVVHHGLTIRDGHYISYACIFPRSLSPSLHPLCSAGTAVALITPTVLMPRVNLNLACIVEKREGNRPNRE